MYTTVFTIDIFYGTSSEMMCLSKGVGLRLVQGFFSSLTTRVCLLVIVGCSFCLSTLFSCKRLFPVAKGFVFFFHFFLREV